jgi:hypothetical protein
MPYLRANTAMEPNPSSKSSYAYQALKFERFLDSLDDDSGAKPQFNVFTQGNGKLPFLAFSSLPGVHCPGAGECLDFCFSFKAWRYPAAFFRQCQNQILINEDFDAIQRAMEFQMNRRKFRNTEKVDFRLYVDGDFNKFSTLLNWMQLLEVNPRVNAYGYSKSLQLFKMYHGLGLKVPPNYVLNLSSGGRFGKLFDFMKTLPYVRDEFIAVNIGHVSSATTRTNDEKRALYKWAKSAGLKGAFVCPGLCGACVKTRDSKNIHACGDMSIFKGKPILIPVH